MVIIAFSFASPLTQKVPILAAGYPSTTFSKKRFLGEYEYRPNDHTDCELTKAIKWEWDMSLRNEARGII
jgi:hypothetical protein